MKKHSTILLKLKKQIGIQLMVLSALVFTIIFNYIPMSGIIIAFKNYRIRTGILASDWSGLSNFRNLFDDFYMTAIIRNTVAISILGILFSFPIVLSFTLLLNEIVKIKFKRFVQTISYLPHFVSWAVMAVIITAMLGARDGVINQFLMNIGLTQRPVNFLTEPKYYWWVAIFSGIWKSMGWSAIVYIAIIAGIDNTLYEAAKIDGAGRFSQMWYITIPSLKTIIAIMLILSVSHLPNVGFDQAYFLSNTVNIEKANVLTYYIYTTGLVDARFSYSTAISLVLSVVSALLMIITNTISKKLSGRGLF